MLVDALSSSDTVIVEDVVNNVVLLNPDASLETVIVKLRSGDAVRVCVFGVAEC